MKKTKQIVALALAAVLLVCTSVAATVAYLTANADVVTNTFTVGNVAIDLDETDVTIYGVKDTDDKVKANDYKLIPGHEYIKDPTVHVVKGSEKCWLFVKVTNGISAIEAAQGTTKADDTTYNTIAKQMEDNGWLPLDGQSGVYYYKDIIDASKANANIDKVVFSEFMVSGTAVLTDAEGNALYSADTPITIDAYAVQADGFSTAALAWAAAPATWN